MSSIFLGKLLVGGGFAAVASTFVWLNWENIMGPPYRDIVVYAKVDSQVKVNSASGSNLLTSTITEYKCEFKAPQDGQDTKDPLSCKIKKLNFDKNQWAFDKSDTTQLNTEDLTTEHNVLQITFKSNSSAWDNSKTTKIDITSDTESADSKKYSTTILFVVDKEKKFGKITHFIGKAGQTTTITKTITQSECSWTEGGSKTECSVYDFDAEHKTEAYHSLEFKKGSSIATAIVKDAHYLIEWNNNHPMTPSQNALIIFSKVVSTDKTEEIQFSGIKSAILVNENLIVFPTDRPSESN